MEQDAKNVIENLQTSSKAYVKMSLILLKLNVYEKTGILISIISYSLVFISMIMAVVVFMLIALGFAFSYLLHSLILGFLTISIICALSTLVVYFQRNNIKRAFLNTIISALEKKDENSR